MAKAPDNRKQTFSGLNRLPRLRVGSKEKPAQQGRRHVWGGINDPVRREFDECQTPAEMAQFAHLFGIPAAEIRQRARGASSLGQFRMVLSHRVRGVISRLLAAERKGKTMTIEQAAEGAALAGKYAKEIKHG